MSTRFEILKNGQRVCVAGIDGDGVLSFGLVYVKHQHQELEHFLQMGGLGMFDGSMDRQHHAAWPVPAVATGDEITIRILPPGEFDQPAGMRGRPQKSIDDVDFGKMSYYLNSWDATFPFDSPPFESARIRVCAEESGLSLQQRQLLKELLVRHVELWPEISLALVKCHPMIKSSEELCARLKSQVNINLRDESSTIELSYKIDCDPEYRAFFVTLRDWEVAEVCMAE